MLQISIAISYEGETDILCDIMFHILCLDLGQTLVCFVSSRHQPMQWPGEFQNQFLWLVNLVTQRGCYLLNFLHGTPSFESANNISQLDNNPVLGFKFAALRLLKGGTGSWFPDLWQLSACVYITYMTWHTQILTHKNARSQTLFRETNTKCTW